MYDVIVAGAGPAGCTAAKILSERGFRVFLAEKMKLPRRKSCSGILIKKTLDLAEQYFGKPVPSSCSCAPAENNGMIFTDARGTAHAFCQRGLNVWRSVFDNWLAEQAAACGTEIADGTAAVSCTESEECVTVGFKGEKCFSESARYLIDCEGVIGSLKRKITGAAPPLVTTFQTFNTGSIDLDPHYFYAYLQPELSEYDAWFNVKDGYLIFGVAVKNPRNVRLFYERFISYMKTSCGLRIAKQLEAEKWLMPHIRPGCTVELGTGRVLFAGETALFLNPMGEGISAAMESGFAAACAVSEQFADKNKTHAAYADKTAAAVNHMKRQWNLVAELSETFAEMKLP
ncbi:MAG: NAD(P)/FAD-dependent oxidoreductase [Bacteroides sp.]|nr:NAD(P)/FAD-dependent oxidoreductase [Prevotella sp.]MCM1408339.1 NAD(P)/FAD-dependent oxidoreductase [Treponema brennaborense]MCM1470429.1 NAD(P)/FAD-dependent oxidoreductase [Bacteroides sp.]